MADVDPALAISGALSTMKARSWNGQEILDVAQRQRVLHVHQHRQTDYLGRAVEIAERVAHGLTLPQPTTTRKIGLTMPSMARPFGRRSACPSPALALDEGARLSTPVRRFRRSRQIDPAEPSLRENDGASVPFDRRAPKTRQGVALKAGALLVREWKGRLERVMTLEEGFAWNGQTFGSRFQIAKAMTGTNWNGHRFFGLRQGKNDASVHGRVRRKADAPEQRMARR